MKYNYSKTFSSSGYYTSGLKSSLIVPEFLLYELLCEMDSWLPEMWNSFFPMTGLSVVSVYGLNCYMKLLVRGRADATS